MKYKVNPNINYITVKTLQGEHMQVDVLNLEKAVILTNETLQALTNFNGVNISELLWMRNLSAVIGEIFVTACVKNLNHSFIKNPHQDGYPDLIAMNTIWMPFFSSINASREKKHFSPFISWWIEVKATCWDVPSAKSLEAKGMVKPWIWVQRLPILTSYNWKAHHRQTNNLIWLFWDFIEWIPTIIGVFFSNELNQDDWWDVIMPTNIDSRTTSVSIMNADGVSKMYKWWVLVIDDIPEYISFFNKRNKANLI